MRKICLAVLFIFSSMFSSLASEITPAGFLQDYKLPSKDSLELITLKRQLKNTDVDSIKWEALSKIFEILKSTNPEEAFPYIAQAEELAVENSNNLWLIESMRMEAYVLDELGHRKEALEILNSAIKLVKTINSKAVKDRLKTFYNNAGIVYMYMGVYDSSLSYHLKSLELKTEQGDIRQMANSHVNIGLTYFRLGNYQQSINHYQTALELKRMIKDESNIVFILNNLSFVYIDNNQEDKAIEIISKGLSTCKDCSLNLQAEMWYGLGVAINRSININEERAFNKVFEPLSKSLTLADSTNYQPYIILASTAIGNLYLKHKSPDQALIPAQRAYEKSLEYNDKALELACVDLLARIYESKNEFQSSTRYFQMYINLKDSIFNNSLIKNLGNIQSSYQEKDNMRVIRLTQESLEEKDRQLLFTISVILIALALIGTLIYVLLKLRNMTQKLEIQVQQRTQDLQVSNQSLQLVNQELNTFLYRASHDIRGPLATLKGLTNVAMIETNPDVLKGFLSGIGATTDKLDNFLNKLVSLYDVTQHEPVTESVNLHTLVDKVFNETNQSNQITILAESTSGVSIKSDRILLTAIVKTLIANAVKFRNPNADKPSLKISVKNEKDFINLLFTDNGKGFGSATTDVMNIPLLRSTEASANGGLGLYIAQVAAGKLNGSVVLLNTSPAGSTFKVKLPV